MDSLNAALPNSVSFKDDLLELILDTVTNRAIVRILHNFSKEKQNELEAIIDSENEDKITTFFLENDINCAHLLSEEAAFYAFTKNLKESEQKSMVKNLYEETENYLENSYQRSFIAKLNWWLNFLLETKPIRQKEYPPEQVKEVAITYLSYQDIDLNELNEDKREEVKELLKMIATNVGNGTDISKDLYSQILLEVTDTYGENTVHHLADAIFNELHAILLKIPNFQKNVYSTSKSWPLWDLAKQFYYFKHPEESSPEYRVANPFTDIEKQQEIIDRHLGWEINLQRDAMVSDRKFRDLWKESPHKAEIETLLSKPLEEDLSSSDLAKLGVVIRTILPQT